jgi:TrmH family RNA methyltransferase
MISKNKANYIISLQKKKIRDEERLFVIEGDKLVKEFLQSRAPVKTLIAKPEFLNSLPLFLKQGVTEIIPASYDELKRISTLKTPHNALAVIVMPKIVPDAAELTKGLTVALDCIQDPGNLGTIIRAAAWFGLKNIYCSHDCVDEYNPKVIQSSMGAILHVNVFYTELKELLGKASEINLPVFGAMLEGESIYTYKLANKGIILLGNESQGISDELLPFITDKIVIPRLTDDSSGIDSLNVSMAASVIFSEFTRSKGRQL